MVKVVGHDASVVKRCTCRNCSAILEYTQSEVKRYEGKDYTGGSDGREWIICPECGKDVTLRAW